MKPTICICCGEPIAARGNALSRNPNVCACCSSLADGMDWLGHGQELAAPSEVVHRAESPVPGLSELPVARDLPAHTEA